MHTGDSYVAVTAHWLDAEWRMMSCVLGVSISNEEIASVVKDLVNVEFMLENRLDSISTDQGDNFIAAVQLLIEEGVSEEQVRCACHKLQLLIKNSLEEKSTPAYALVCLFRTITTTINNSPMLLDALKKRQHNPELLIIDSDKSGDEECSDNEEEIDPTNVLSGCKHGLKLIKDLQSSWGNLPSVVQIVRSFILKDMRARWDPTGILLDTAGAGAIITLDHSDVIEPPTKRRATEADDDFNVLFGCSDNIEQEAVHALDDDIDDKQRYLKEVEINFRKDDPLMWWKCQEHLFRLFPSSQESIWRF
eukprot:Em0004g970a